MSAQTVQAQTAEDKAEVTARAVERVRCSLDWLQAQTPMTPTQMDHWDHLVCFSHTANMKTSPGCCWAETSRLLTMSSACPLCAAVGLGCQSVLHFMLQKCGPQ